MRAMDLLKALGNVKDSYVLGAEAFRQGRGQSKGNRLPLKRIWLLAALVALMLLLVGCGLVYYLRLQDMKVGEYSFYVPTEYDEEGNVIHHETHEPIIQLSLQGSNMEALKEWKAFTNTYDPELKIANEADRTGSAWELPDNYHPVSYTHLTLPTTPYV